MGDTDHLPEEALRTLDAELAAIIERLQQARVELGLILHGSVPTDPTTAEFDALPADTDEQTRQDMA